MPHRVAAFVALLACCCTPMPLPGPFYEPELARDSLDTSLGQVCVHLRKLHCPEGYPSGKTRQTCFEVLSATQARMPIPDECIRASSSQEEVRRCGGPTTLRVRCVMPSVDQE